MRDVIQEETLTLFEKYRATTAKFRSAQKSGNVITVEIILPNPLARVLAVADTAGNIYQKIDNSYLEHPSNLSELYMANGIVGSKSNAVTTIISRPCAFTMKIREFPPFEPDEE